MFVLVLLISGRAQKILHTGWSHTVYSSFPWTSKLFDSAVPSSELFHPLGKIMIKPVYLDLFKSHTGTPTTLTGHWGPYQMIHCR